MVLFLLSIAVSYAIFTFVLWLTFRQIPPFRPNPVPSSGSGPVLSVIIPVRNEALNIKNLLDDLARQTYTMMEVIVADDSSTDDTRAIVQAYADQASYKLRLLSLTDERTASPKKRAITQSIDQATGELIVTTDGDCRVGPDWLATIAAFYRETGAKLISGPVTFTTNTTLFDSLQTVEFASLIGSGACTLALGYPTMCNGANLCYEKKVFREVNGFDGVDHLASGDDELLMHKIAVRYGHGIRFLKSSDAIVTTKPHQTWTDFFYQRKRWASKWRTYKSWTPTLLAVFVFLSNTVPVVAILGWLLGFLDGYITLLVVGLKVLPEFLFLREILVFLQKKSSVRAIPMTQLIYPLYVVFFGLAAQGKGYRWKGRKLT